MIEPGQFLAELEYVARSMRLGNSIHCFAGQDDAASLTGGFALGLRSYEPISLSLLIGGADVPLVDNALSSCAAATPDLLSALPPTGAVYERDN